MAVFWDVAPCNLVDTDDVPDELTASIVRKMSHDSQGFKSTNVAWSSLT
jgi:hypothetical protein